MVGWQTHKLGDVCSFVRGPFGGSLKKSCFVAEGYAVYEQQHAINNQFREVRYYVDQKKFEEMQRFELQPGDLIMSCSGTMGKVAVVPPGIKQGIINQALLKLSVNGTLDVEFLRRWMESPHFQTQLEKSTKGVAIKNVASVKVLKEIEIIHPQLREQKRIVAILDDAFERIDTAIVNTEKNLTNARELFESYLNNVFTQKGEGWEEKALGEVCENLDNKRVPITKSKREPGSIPYYGASGVVDYVKDFIFDEDLLLVSEDGANLLARTYPIAFSINGKTWVNNHAHVLRFEDMRSQKFIEYYLNSISLEPYVSGMAQPKLNQKKLKAIKVPFPDVDAQGRVVEDLEALQVEVQRLEAIYQQKLDALTELKQSILQKAFAGELTADMTHEELVN